MPSALYALNFGSGSGTTLPGLVSVHDDIRKLSVDEQAAIRQAEALGDIDHVFFRRFSDGRSSQIAAYVIDNGDDRFSETQLADIHRRLWLNGSAPLLYVGWQTRVDVLTCAAGPEFWKNETCVYRPAEQIETASAISNALAEQQRRFSAYRLSDGTFWDDPQNAKLARAEKAAHRRLIDAVKDADRDLDGANQPVLRRLLLLMVLIKYLEDRGVFPNGWFSQFHAGADSFFALLKQGTPDEVRELLGRLERKFNGDVFDLPEDGKNKLTATALRRFAELVEKRTLKAQRYLWDAYSFKHIPVEVLSHLYQHFAQRGKGAVFTPPFVASLMLDYALPYASLRGDERVLDPTCGSGVFLVGAFRRLVHHWQSRNQWRQPDVAVLKAILKRSIFGVELQDEAAHLAAFSLALAVCDALQPKVIWRELRFDKLIGSNLLTGDFFERLPEVRRVVGEVGFNVVVGNPPFLSKLSDAAARTRLGDKTLAPLPDNQVAHFIAEQAMPLLGQGGRLCLIQPSGFLYNAKTRPFQRAFLAAHRLDAVLDFTSIRSLYDGADPKTVALVAIRQAPSPNHRIRHLTFRRTFSVLQRLCFELDHYDKHFVAQGAAEKHAWVWRVNLLGGGRLVQLAERIDSMPKLRDFVQSQGWDYGEGFIAATTGKRDSAPWLTGKPFLPTEALTMDGIDESKVITVKQSKFRSAYTESRYSAPIVMIRAHESLPAAFRAKGFLAFKAKIIGVSAPPSKLAEIRKFHSEFDDNRGVLRACCLMLGTQALVGKATAILKRDIDVLPWPQAGERWQLAPWEKILADDVVSYASEFVRLGQKSRLFKRQATDGDLRTYANLFVELLGTVYPNLRPVKSGTLDGLAYQAFCFGKFSELDWPADWSEPLRKVIYFQHGAALRTVRVLRFYEANTIVIVKPDRLRYWIRSTAIRDADETLVDLQRQGF